MDDEAKDPIILTVNSKKLSHDIIKQALFIILVTIGQGAICFATYKFAKNNTFIIITTILMVIMFLIFMYTQIKGLIESIKMGPIKSKLVTDPAIRKDIEDMIALRKEEKKKIKPLNKFVIIRISLCTFCIYSLMELGFYLYIKGFGFYIAIPVVIRILIVIALMPVIYYLAGKIASLILREKTEQKILDSFAELPMGFLIGTSSYLLIQNIISIIFK
jgi:hypothetical protein